MATEKLFQSNPYQETFSAHIVNQYQKDGNWIIELDRTCFYPGGGGQPPDTGWINELPVVNVTRQDDTILHILDQPVLSADKSAPLRNVAQQTGPQSAGSQSAGSQFAGPQSAGPEPTDRVAGRIDFVRRLDYMQQHTGQHIISASFVKTGDYPTVSVHLGETYTAVEIDVKEISERALLQVEETANAVINRNVPVTTFFIESAELHKYPLRRPAPNVDRVRIVEIEDCDRAACGGTHLRRTGEVGLIKYIGKERIRKRIRTHWKIGGRAYQDYAEKTRILSTLSQELTCGFDDIHSQILSLKDFVKEQGLMIKKLEKDMIHVEMKELLNGAALMGPCKFVTARYVDRSQEWLKILTGEIIKLPGIFLVFFAGDSDQPDSGRSDLTRIHWIAAKSPDVDLSVIELIKPHLDEMGGKGGGSHELCQGIVRNADGIERFLESVTNAIEKGNI